MTEHTIEKTLRQKWDTYEQLAGAAHTLQAGPLFWTERALLRLVEALAWRRLEQLGTTSSKQHNIDQRAVRAINDLSERIYPQAVAVSKMLDWDIDAATSNESEFVMFDEGYSIQTVKIDNLLMAMRYMFGDDLGFSLDFADYPEEVESFLDTYAGVYGYACSLEELPNI